MNKHNRLEYIRKRADEVLSKLKHDGEILELIAKSEIELPQIPYYEACELEGPLYYSMIDRANEKYSNIQTSNLILTSLRRVVMEEIDLDNLWSLAQPEEDPHLALIAKYGDDRGAYIRVRRGSKVGPVRTCYISRTPGSVQFVHNVYVVEDNAELQVLSTCLAEKYIPEISHISLTEVILGENSRFTMIMYHSWNETTKLWSSLRILAGPRSKVTILYITHTPIGKMDGESKIILKDESSLNYSSIIYGRGGYYKSRVESYLEGSNSNSIIISRIIGSLGSQVESITKIVAEGSDSRGHIECLGITLDPKSRIVTVPALEAKRDDVQLSHEAAIGKFSEEELVYLMSKGLTEDEAKQVLVRGFVSIEIPELPQTLKNIVDRIVQKLSKYQSI